jgi:hypothetical protein
MARGHGAFKIVRQPGYSDFLGLPWEMPLRAWPADRVVEVARGISRHVVRFVEYDDQMSSSRWVNSSRRRSHTSTDPSIR